MSARDLARFGQLYLQKGSWNGRQIVPREWVEMSTTAYSTVSEQMGIGYGFMWNVVPPGSPFANMLFDGKGGSTTPVSAFTPWPSCLNTSWSASIATAPMASSRIPVRPRRSW